jgi:hypothetical protein
LRNSEYDGKVIKSNETIVTTVKKPFDCKTDFLSGSQPQSSFFAGFRFAYHAYPSKRNVLPTKIGRNGSRNEKDDARLDDPPTKPRKGTMQHKDALVDVRIVNIAEAFITFPKL